MTDKNPLGLGKAQVSTYSFPSSKMGLTSATFLVIANMVGAGVFTTSGFALESLGHPELVMLVWLFGGVLALLGALCYGALAKYCPESGGEYTFLRCMVHPVLAYMAGWVSLLAGFTAPIAAAALALQAYMGWLWPAHLDFRWLGTIAIVLAGAIHSTKLHNALKFQNLIIFFKLLLIVSFIVACMNHELPNSVVSNRINIESISQFEISNFAVSLIWVSFAYSGWNAAVYIGGEIKQAEKNLNRSLIIGTLFVIILYLALNWVFLYTMPVQQVSGKVEVAVIVAKYIGGDTLYRLVTFFVSLALFTSILAMVMTGPRVYARMADDGVFPKFLRTKRSNPHSAIIFQVVLAVAVLWLSELAELLSYVGFTLGISAAITIAAFMRFKYRNIDQSVSIPGYPWLPLTFIGFTLLSAGFLFMQTPAQAAIGMATLILGIPIYYLSKRFGGDNIKRDSRLNNSVK